MHETAILLHTSNRETKGTREDKKGAREGKKGTREGKKGAREGKKGAAPFYFGLAGTLFFNSITRKFVLFCKIFAIFTLAVMFTIQSKYFNERPFSSLEIAFVALTPIV